MPAVPERSHFRLRRGNLTIPPRNQILFAQFSAVGTTPISGHHQDQDDRVDVHGGQRPKSLQTG